MKKQLLAVTLAALFLLTACSPAEPAQTANDLSDLREPLIRTIDTLKASDAFTEYAPRDCFALALFDVTGDDTPELIEAEPGGSSGNIDYYAYDLHTADEICAFSGGLFGGWALYRRVSDGGTVHPPIGHHVTRSGGEERYRCISTIAYDEQTGTYREQRLFYSQLVLDPNDAASAYITYSLGDEPVEPDAYFAAYDRFLAEYIRLGTEMVLTPWDTTAESATVADALLAAAGKAS